MLGLSSDRKFWTSTDKKGLDDSKQFAVQAGSAEHAAVCARFAETLPYATIDQLERVENGYMHEQFALTAANQQKQVGGYNPKTMRQMLFHGAVPTVAAAAGVACKPFLLEEWRLHSRHRGVPRHNTVRICVSRLINITPHCSMQSDVPRPKNPLF
jgi:hypothetical protein